MDKKELEARLSTLRDILLNATINFRIVEFLTAPESDEDRRFVKNRNYFFYFSQVIHWRDTVIELHKLFSKNGRTNKFNIWDFIKSLEPGGQYEELQISQNTIDHWKDKLTEEFDALNNFELQRNKAYAHTD